MLNGRKTWLGLILVNLGIVFTEAGNAVTTGSVDPQAALKIIGALTVMAGAAHKLAKGE